MKRLFFLFCIMMISSALFADNIFDGDFSFPFKNDSKSESETQTLLSGDFSVSGFGGPITTFGKIKDSYAIFTGARGGAIFNDTLILGAGGYGLSYPVKREDLSGTKTITTQDGSEELKYVGLGYGGPMIGINFFQKSVINMSLTSIIGAGGLYLSSKDITNESQTDDNDDYHHNTDVFFVCEPTLMAHINVTKWFRLGGGISYRFTNGIDKEEFSDKDFRNISYVVSAEFGWF